MRRNVQLLVLGLLVLSLSLFVSGCGKQAPVKEAEKAEGETIKIGCMPITESIVTFLAEGLEKEGYKIEPVVFDGNHLPATALKEGSIDGVILNHKVWLDTFNKENASELVMPEPYMYYFRNAMYSSKYDSLEEIPSGATIAVPGDPSNLDRSLRILEDIGFLKLGEKTGEFYSRVDIEDNLKDIKILETEITATARSMKDVDAIIAGANLLREAGYDHTTYLYDDPLNKDFPLGLIVGKEDENADWVKAILEEQEKDEFRDKFNKRYDFTYVLFE